MWNTREYRYDGDVLMLKCTICGERRHKEDYPKAKGKRFGVRSDCRECNRIKASKRYIKHKEKIDEKSREYYRKHRLEINEKVRQRAIKHSEDVGFGRYKFHALTKYYIKKHNLRPSTCSICGLSSEILVHHPSYENFDKWSEVVFCCKSCHSKIHNGVIECPKPTNLLELDIS